MLRAAIPIPASPAPNSLRLIMLPLPSHPVWLMMIARADMESSTDRAADRSRMTAWSEVNDGAFQPPAAGTQKVCNSPTGFRWTIDQSVGVYQDLQEGRVTTALRVILSREGVPACRMIVLNSRRSISRTTSTPDWPNAANPHASGLPVPTAVAPSARALKMNRAQSPARLTLSRQKS